MQYGPDQSQTILAKYCVLMIVSVNCNTVRLTVSGTLTVIYENQRS